MAVAHPASTDTAKGTVLKLLADVGRACAEYQDQALRDLSCRRIQCDEVWSFEDLAGRLSHRVQLTTDGHRVYLEAVEAAFGANVDYAMLVKIHGSDPEAETRYSPAKCLGTQFVAVNGRPDPAHISTSFVKRQNLTMRMSMRRFTRLTNLL